MWCLLDVRFWRVKAEAAVGHTDFPLMTQSRHGAAANLSDHGLFLLSNPFSSNCLGDSREQLAWLPIYLPGLPTPRSLDLTRGGREYQAAAVADFSCWRIS